MTPLLSIVVPVRNRQALVSRTLDSIAAQTYRPFRLIIVDNGSTDSSLQVVEKWADAHASDEGLDIAILSEPTKGAANARNRGLEAVDTDFVMFFDSDDEMRPRHLERIAEYLSLRPDTDLLRWDVAYIDSDGWSTVKNQRFHDELQLHIIHGTLSTLRYAVRASFIREAGGWNRRLANWDDLELGSRLILRAPKLKKLYGEPQVVVHPQDDSITGTNLADTFDRHVAALDAIEEAIHSNSDDPDYLNILDSKRIITAALLSREGAAEQARQLKEQALNGQPLKNRLKLRTIYFTTKIIGRGGGAAALFLLGKKAPKS